MVRFILINDLWDRSPCTWICDVTKLDQNDSVQKEYYDAIIKALASIDCGEYSRDRGEISWYEPGTGVLEMSGRPEEVEHARVIPPCRVDAIINFYYE